MPNNTKDGGSLPYGVRPPAFRLPDATHVGAVHLQVSDLKRSLAYYQQLLGLHAYNATIDTASLGAQGDERPLVTLHTRSGVRHARRGSFGLFHFAILLPERAALGRFAAHVSVLGVPVAMADHLVSEALYLTDPDGLGIEVYADRPRNAWQHHNGELALTTDALDIRGVIAAGGGHKWDGAPPGTTMGHVHLHVGTLDGAEAFYHRAVGFDKTVWSYPGALFLSAGGYHHHLGTNTWSPGPAPTADQARLLEWDLLVPTFGDIQDVKRSLEGAGYTAEDSGDGVATVDPWGTRMRIRVA